MKKAILAFILTMAVASQAFSDEIDEVRELLAKEKGGDILYLSKINLGFPGGDNWIADRNDGWTYIYTINDDNEVKRVDGLSTTKLSEVRYWVRTDTYVDLEYDIMQGISGTQIGNKAAKFDDYNGDGRDEVFVLNPYNESNCFILGYNNDNGEEKFYFISRFIIADPEGPVPVIFTNYQGLDGILIYSITFEGQNVWYFFVLNEAEQKYVRLKEIGIEELDYSMFPLVKPKENGNSEQEKNEASVVEIELPEAEEEFADDSGKNSRFIFYIAIAVGVIALALFFAVRRKKG